TSAELKLFTGTCFGIGLELGKAGPEENDTLEVVEPTDVGVVGEVTVPEANGVV
ncbi:8784_t:CDS:1, partial [Racocetra fulgida]